MTTAQAPSGTERQPGDPVPRYETVARFVSDLVESGTLLPGAKAPSLRQISQQQNVSMTTAMTAYRLLESRGVIEARPQSGFYVRAHSNARLPVPKVSRPPSRPVSVSVSAEVSHMLLLSTDPNLLALGCAIPSPDLLSASRLDKFLARAARTRGGGANAYAPANGDESLRRNIALRSARFGNPVAVDDIVITNGCTEALHLALRATTRPGDTVAIESPTYFGLLQVLQSMNLKVLELPTDPASGVVVDALADALASGVVNACLLASSFNNPLGCVVPDDNKRAILKLLNRHQVPLIEDDIYGDLYFGNQRPVPYSAMPEARDVLYCNSFSKTLAPGYRIGWVSSAKWRQTIVTHKFGVSLCAPSLTQMAMADYLDSGAYDLHLRRMRSAFAGNIANMSRALADSFPSATRISQPAGGFVLWLQMPAGVNAATVFHKALESGICIAPGTLFSAGNRYQNFIRISCGYPWTADIDRKVGQLGQIVCDLAD